MRSTPAEIFLVVPARGSQEGRIRSSISVVLRRMKTPGASLRFYLVSKKGNFDSP